MGKILHCDRVDEGIYKVFPTSSFSNSVKQKNVMQLKKLRTRIVLRNTSVYSRMRLCRCKLSYNSEALISKFAVDKNEFSGFRNLYH